MNSWSWGFNKEMEEANYPLTNLEVKINGRDLRIVGVEYTPEFFEEHEEFFKEIICKLKKLINKKI